MKIQCQSCQAKYTIADEKVVGKVVKIRCKKCSATIVINGNEHQPSSSADDGADTSVFDYNQSNDQWTVNVADGDQRTLTVAEITTEYRSGVINDETFCWKDGMADWLPLREIEQLYGAVKLAPGGAADAAPAKSIPPQQPAAPLFAPAPAADESPFAAHSNGNGSAGLFGGAEQAAPAAARRAGGRAQGADLFGNVEKAGGEEDVMTSATAATAAAAAAAPAVEEKPTGARNESSVLFSLSALTEKKADAPGGNRTTATADGSGLIDIRALSANMDAGEKKKDGGARVDDIMNLSGGGAFGAALAAPILAPPPIEAIDGGAGAAPPQKQSKTLVFAILGGCAFIAAAIVAAVVLTKGGGSDAAKGDKERTGTVASATAEATPSASVAAADTNAGSTAAPAPTGNTPAAPGTGVTTPTTPAGGQKLAVNGGGNAAPTPKGADHNAAPAPAPDPPKTPDKPKSLNDALNDAVGKPKTDNNSGGGGGGTAPFDRGAAAAAIGAVNVQSCKKPDGPTGSGHVQITFGPDGSVQSAVIDSGPFPGTAVGGCIAGKYRGAHVPPFAGAPVKVGKSFTIN